MVTSKGHTGCHLAGKWPSFIRQPYFPTLPNAETAHSVNLSTMKLWSLGTVTEKNSYKQKVLQLAMENNLFSRLFWLKMHVTAFPVLYVQKKNVKSS